jgi:ADP-ribosylation factor-like protein 2
MGLLSYLKSLTSRNTNAEIRILILGLDNSGKSTILRRLSDEDILDVRPTQGFQVKTLTQSDFQINMWDVGGQKSIRSYWRNYFEQTDGIIWVIDSVDRFRLEECKNQLRDILKQEVRFHPHLLVTACCL